MAEPESVRTKRTRARAKSTKPRTVNVRELDEEEIYVLDPEPERPVKRDVRKSYQLNVSIPSRLSDAWNHVVNAESEYVLAVLSFLGIDERKLDDMAQKSRARTQSERRRDEERIEVREVRVE